MISFGLMLLRQPLDLVEVDEMVVLANSVLDRVEPLAGLGRRSTVREVAASSEAQAHDRVARLQKRQHHRAVRLRAGVRLDVGEAGSRTASLPARSPAFRPRRTARSPGSSGGPDSLPHICW